MKMLKLSAGCLVASIAFSLQALGGVVVEPPDVAIVSPESVEASSTLPSQFGDFDPNYIIDQSGLSETYQSGITDFYDFVEAVTHVDGKSGNAWASDFLADDPNPYLQFDFGESIDLVALAIWPDADNTANIDEFEVMISDDPTFSVFASLGIFNAYNPEGAPQAADVFSLTPGSGQYVRLQVNSTHGTSFAATSEVAFGVGESVVIPESSTWMLMGLGGIIILGFRRFRARA